jgi:hypothetical protein
MDPNPAPEELPTLYRAVLDRVAELQESGQRNLANRVRADAIRIYSRSWDDRARHDLQALIRRNGETPAGREPLGRSLRRRSARAT